jgi:hypothetical protein
LGVREEGSEEEAEGEEKSTVHGPPSTVTLGKIDHMIVLVFSG